MAVHARVPGQAARAGAPLAAPQLPMPRQLSVYDGLPSNRINALAEDRQGYLWIATRDGLARYDGVGFRVWRVGDGLRDNHVWTVFVDDRDRVWIGTQNAGLSMLDAQRRGFTHFDRSSHPQIASNDVWSLAQTRDGAIWFGTSDGGLHRLDDDGIVTRFAPGDDPRSLPSQAVTWLRVDGDGHLWVGSYQGLARWTGDGFDRMLQDVRPSSAVNGLVLDDAGDLWIGTSGAAYVYRAASGRIDPAPWRDPVQGEPVLAMLVQDRQGAHWLDTRSGLAIERDGVVQDVPLYSNTSRGLVRPTWSAALEDREGGLWFASSETGLWHLPANWRNFTVLRRDLDDPASPGNAFVYSASPALDGGLWLVGTGGVLDWLDPQTARIEHRLSGVCGDLLPYVAREMRDRSVWIGCPASFTRFVPATGEVQRWRHGDAVDPTTALSVTELAEEPDGSVWLGATDELQLRAPDGRLLRVVRAGGPEGFPVNNALQQMSHGPDGALWLATSAGVLMWNAGEGRFQPVPGGPEWQVFAFGFAPDARVWIAGNGVLMSYHWTGAELVAERTVDARQGMPAVAPGALIPDELGVVWMTTPRGLVRYDPARDRLRLYSVLDGLPSQQFSDLQFQPSARGYIGAGTADGLLLFHPRHVQVGAGERTPTLSIESVSVRRGEDRLELSTTEDNVLRHDDRDLRVAARLLSFTDAHAHRYRFRLADYDPDWVEVDAVGERLFPSLRHGHYMLEVQARTADEDWTPAIELRFKVQEPWWRTPWAKVGWVVGALLLLALLAGQYRARLKRRHAWQLAEEKRELAEQASLAKTRFLATLGHEVRTPMTGVLGMSELLASTDLDARQRGHVESIRRAGEHLLRLVNDALDLARIEADRLELDEQPFDLHALIRETVEFCRPLAQQRGLAFDSTIADGVPRWVLGDVGRVRQILLNLLGNAVKFTERGSVTLKAEPRRAAGVCLTVRDTGPGLNEEQKQRLFRRFEQAEGARTTARYGGSGLGLAISQELAAAMGGRIDIDSTPGVGTSFLVELPLQAVRAPAGAGIERLARADRLSLLLVEDDATIAEVVAGLLEGQGHRVVHVAHGLAALSEIAAQSFDAALLDLDLPGIDGLTLAQLMRQKGFSQPLIAVTARADGEAEAATQQAGFDAFVRKPVTGAMLAEALASALPAAGTDFQDSRG
ncbi:sensor histidine kinase [Luteimonas saliphila]|uniref:sensor histidine kinase n=1 Tax=Luteimonas saliphila TaxID=2804919 RepID=UPI00192DCEF4|nr:hybrid sensor histidine kinase/response regulator [Luteimonas saliphila]